MATEPRHLYRLLAFLDSVLRGPLDVLNRSTPRLHALGLVTMNPTRGDNSPR